MTSEIAKGNGSNKPIAIIRDQLERSLREIKKALPLGLDPQRQVRLALTMVQSSEKLLQCDPLSIVRSVVECSQLGLDLDGHLGHAWLVPFWSSKKGTHEATLIVGYKGLVSLAHRSGTVRHFSAQVAHENDQLDYNLGTTSYLHHKPTLKDRGEPIAVYAIVAFRPNGEDFEIIGWEEVLKLKAKYGKKKDSPWNDPDSLEEMARKTALRRLAKRVPLSADWQRAAQHADVPGGGPSNVRELSETGPSRSDELANKLTHKPNLANDAQWKQIQRLREQLGMTDDLGFLEFLGAKGYDTKTLTVEQAEELMGDMASLAEQPDSEDEST